MRRVRFRPVSVARWLFLPAVVAVVAGCQKEEDVSRYTEPRPVVPAGSAEPAPREGQRLLGTLVLRGDELWVFKLMGPDAAIKAHKPDYEAFIDSLVFTDAGRMPEYKLPSGWRPSKGTQFSVAAFQVGPDEDAPELTVTPARGSVTDNVNRWRGQLGLKPVSGDDVRKSLREKQLGGASALLVELSGPGSGKRPGGMMAGHPPIGGKMPPAVRGDGGAKPGLKYTTPEGWKEGKQTQFSLAAFRAGEGGNAADVTVTALPGSAGGLLANVNRWRQQLGLAAWTEDQFTKEATSLMVAGNPAAYVDFAGGGKGILGALLSRNGQTWFFKMTGPADAVERQKAAFEAFVKSVRFEGGAGND